MPQKIKYLRPRLSPPPNKFDGKEVLDFLSNIRRQLQEYFNDSELVLADHDLIGSNYLQNLSAGFTINPNAFFISMYATGAISSNATTAIKNGKTNQRVVLLNLSSVNITIKSGANVKLNGSVDDIVTPNGTLTLFWAGSTWIELGRSNP